MFHGKQTLAFLLEAAKDSSDDVPSHIRAARAATAWTWQNVVQRIWATYVIARVVEESIKYLPIAYIRHHHPPSTDQHKGYSSLQCAVAAGLGFSTMENLLDICGGAHTGKSWQKLATTLVERGILRDVYACARHCSRGVTDLEGSL